MYFADLIFIYIFLPVNICLYFISKNRNYRNVVLLAFSFFFYAWGEPIWISLLIISALADYIHGLVIERYRGGIGAKLAVASSLIINLGLLCTFKYSSFIVSTVNGILGTAFDVPGFALPVGISFYTFQTISYTIDVYREEVEPQHDLIQFMLFVSLYHQLVAGPIVRYSEIGEKIAHRSESWEEASAGINRFIIGLFKKSVIANTAGKLAEPYLAAGNISSLSTLGAWFGIVLYALQIYYDFSGYSDMAIGLGHIFGFTHPENFKYPYMARSATEFWRRWHITLGGFFRDYLYIPLGGKRRHMVRNLIITWFATGLWHGASWNFVIWGLYYGLLIIFERLWFGKILKKIPRIFSHMYLITVMLVGWVFFTFTDLGAAVEYIGKMFFIGCPVYDLNCLLDIAGCVVWLLLSIIFCMPFAPLFAVIWSTVRERDRVKFAWVRPVFNVAMLYVCTAMLVGQSYNPFLYFRF